jgi:hypothetical protein
VRPSKCSIWRRNRLALLLGLDLWAEQPRYERVPSENGGKGKVARVCNGTVPFAQVARFPHGIREALGQMEHYARYQWYCPPPLGAQVVAAYATVARLQAEYDLMGAHAQRFRESDAEYRERLGPQYSSVLDLLLSPELHEAIAVLVADWTARARKQPPPYV